MRLSIWQQFSSNNSGSFVVVGKFKTVEDAQKAGGEFYRFLKSIFDWYAVPQNKSALPAWGDYTERPLTPVEQDIAEQYDIEFDYAIDWIDHAQNENDIAEAVNVFEDYVLVACIRETEATDQPIAQLMRKLGAAITYSEGIGQGLLVNISCTAPDDETAKSLAWQAESYLKAEDSVRFFTMPAPWVQFYAGQKVPNPEQFSAQLNVYIEHHRAEREFDRAHRAERDEISRQRDAAYREKNMHKADELTQKLVALYNEMQQVLPSQPPEIANQVHKAMNWTCAEILPDDGGVAINGTELKMTGLKFFDTDVGHAVPAIIEWLRHQGCANIQYEFVIKTYE